MHERHPGWVAPGKDPRKLNVNVTEGNRKVYTKSIHPSINQSTTALEEYRGITYKI